MLGESPRVNPSADSPPSRKELWAWCLYDFANSSFTTLIVTVGFSVYFVQVVGRNLPQEAPPERLWFWGYAVSMVVVALLSPALGALADARALKRRFLIGSTLICVTSTALLTWVGVGDVWMGLILFGIANIAFDLGFLFCSAFLVEIVPKNEMGRMSGYGWGLGYLGGLLSLALAYPFLRGGFAEDNLSWYRLSFAMTALFFLVASLPTFFWLRERARPLVQDVHESAWRQSYRKLRTTFRQIRRYRDLFSYLVSYLIYTDGINTVIVASGIFANKVLDFSPSDLIIYFMVTHVTAGLGSLGFGHWADRVGAKRVISVTLVCWMVLTICAAFVQTHAQFYAIGLVAGAVLGANQATSRALVGQLTPVGNQAEFFSFFSVTGKFAAILGPLVYGEVTAWTGNHRWAILAMSGFFAVGLVVFQFVNEERGIATAKLSSDVPLS